MPLTKELIQLRDALYVLIPFRENALIFLNDAHIDTAMISFSNEPLVLWNDIVTYTHNNEQIDDLVDAILKRYPKNNYLLTFKENRQLDYTPGPDIHGIQWEAAADEETQEKLMQAVSTLLPIRFLSDGIKSAAAVARVTVPMGKKPKSGSGFLIAGNLFVTNNHVLPNPEQAEIAVIDFNYDEPRAGQRFSPLTVKLEPKVFFKTSRTEDWTIVALPNPKIKKMGFLTLSPTQAAKDDYVNIVQHPGGRYKQIGLYHNLVTFADDHIVQYLTDTEPGSSGSPVFNSAWEVVAIHHSGGALKEPGLPGTRLRNEGIAVEKIIQALKS